MNGQRLTAAAVDRLVLRLSERDWSIVHSLSRARVLSAEQLSRLHFSELSPLTQHRIRRRVLKRLTDWQVVSRLERDIGGVRAGSTGWIYSLGPAGQRLVQLDAGNHRGDKRVRQPWTPGTLFLRHSLDVAEVYVQLIEATSTPELSLNTFEAEPACWWPDGLGGFLKPDAFLVLRTAAFDELVWLEVDRGTESLPTLRRKLLTYRDFGLRGQLGPNGVMPHVVITTLTEARAQDIQELIETIGLTKPSYLVVPFTDASRTILELASDLPP